MTCFPSSASASSCSSSSTSHLASPPVRSPLLLLLLHFSGSKWEPHLPGVFPPSFSVYTCISASQLFIYSPLCLPPCSSPWLRFSICVPKLWPPLPRRQLGCSSRISQEEVAAARTHLPVIPMTLSWCPLTLTVRTVFVFSNLHSMETDRVFADFFFFDTKYFYWPAFLSRQLPCVFYLEYCVHNCKSIFCSSPAGELTSESKVLQDSLMNSG